MPAVFFDGRHSFIIKPGLFSEKHMPQKTKKKRKKIQFCFEDYCKTLPVEDKQNFLDIYSPLVRIIQSSESDEEILNKAKEFDSINNTDIFSQAVNFTIYCIACHRFDCIC